MVPTPMMMQAKPIPASNPSCLKGTLPTNMRRKTLPANKTAVERFSVTMSPQVAAVMPHIYLKAFLLAPFSSCMRERMNATVMMVAILATSEG